MRQTLRGRRTLWRCGLVVLAAAIGCGPPRLGPLDTRRVVFQAANSATEPPGDATARLGEYHFTVAEGPVLIRAYQVRNGAQTLKAWMVFDPAEHPVGVVSPIVLGDHTAIEFGAPSARRPTAEKTPPVPVFPHRVVFPTPQGGLASQLAASSAPIDHETPVLSYIIGESLDAAAAPVDLSGPNAIEAARTYSAEEPGRWFVVLSCAPASKEDAAREAAMAGAVRELNAQEQEARDADPGYIALPVNGAGDVR